MNGKGQRMVMTASGRETGTMELLVPYIYRERWVPPRCRNARWRDQGGVVTVDIPEATGEEAPVALIWHRAIYGDGEKPAMVLPLRMRAYGGALYVPRGPLLEGDDVAPRRGVELEDVLGRIDAEFGEVLLIDGKPYRRRKEPRYAIARNFIDRRRSVVLFVDADPDPERSSFALLDRDAAMDAAREVAVRWGADPAAVDQEMDRVELVRPDLLTPAGERPFAVALTVSLEIKRTVTVLARDAAGARERAKRQVLEAEWRGESEDEQTLKAVSAAAPVPEDGRE